MDHGASLSVTHLSFQDNQFTVINHMWLLHYGYHQSNESVFTVLAISITTMMADFYAKLENLVRPSGRVDKLLESRSIGRRFETG